MSLTEKGLTPKISRVLLKRINMDSKNKLNLSVLSELSDRFNVSDRACAAVASGVLTVNGVINGTKHESVIWV